jgi:hypothetical protein
MANDFIIDVDEVGSPRKRLAESREKISPPRPRKPKATVVDYQPESQEKPSTDLARYEPNRDLISALIAPVANVPVRKLAYDSAQDPFDLLKVEDVYEEEAKRLFRGCERFSSIQLALPSNRELLRRYHKRHAVRFGEVEFDRFRAFYLMRVNTATTIQYSFRRVEDDTVNDDTGFDLIKTSSGTVVLRNGDNSKMKDADYFGFIQKAQDFLAVYFMKTSDSLVLDRLCQKGEITFPKYYTVPKPLIKVHNALHNYVHPKGIVAKPGGSKITKVRNGVRGFSWARAASVPVIGLLALGSLQVGDNLVNASEHARQGFDSAKTHLEVGTLGENGKPSLGAPNRLVATSAPAIESGTDGIQNMVGTRTTDLTLGSGECESTYVDTNGKSTLKAMSDNKDIAENLSLKLTPDGDSARLEICNLSDDLSFGAYDIETNNHLWMEAV